MTHDGRNAQLLALTLVAGGAEESRRLGDHARDALGEAGGALVAERVLSPRALEVSCHGDIDRVRQAVEARLAGGPTDWGLQPGPARPRRLLLCDMDSTIIGCECIDELAAILGIGEDIAEITTRAMAGELKFEPALIERVSRLAGARQADLERAYAERVRLNPGAATLTATMRAHGARSVLVSGGFSFFTERVARAAGFDSERGNTLEIVNGVLTGKVVPPVLGRNAKKAALEDHARELGIALADTVAIGDGANDLDMLAAAGLGIAYRAKPVLEAVADARIVGGDLRSALYFQGIAETDFVERG